MHFPLNICTNQYITNIYTYIVRLRFVRVKILLSSSKCLVVSYTFYDISEKVIPS